LVAAVINVHPVPVVLKAVCIDAIALEIIVDEQVVGTGIREVEAVIVGRDAVVCNRVAGSIVEGNPVECGAGSRGVVVFEIIVATAHAAVGEKADTATVFGEEVVTNVIIIGSI